MNHLVKLCFYPSLAFNLVLAKFSGRQWYSKVDDTVILGALPFRWMTKQLVEIEGVKAVVSLNEDHELKLTNTEEQWKKHGVELLKLPTKDFVSAPSQKSLQTAVNFLMECKENRSIAYVHCKAGRTRSATVAACYLMMANGWPPLRAVNLLKEKRPHVWLRDKQMQALQCFYNENVKKNSM